MVITLFAPAQKTGRASKAPGSILGRHNLDKWVSFRSASTETIWKLFEGTSRDATFPIGDIASILRQKLAGDAERPITSRYVGQMLRAEFGLSTYKKHGNYVLSASEYEKVKHIAKKYGVTE